MKLKIASGFCLIVASSHVWSTPQVLADFGGKPTEFLKMQELKKGFISPLSSNIPKDIDIYPLESALSIGVVENYEHHKKIVTPIFIVGVDDVSVEWLRVNEPFLLKIGAKGIVTNVSTANAFSRLKNIFPAFAFFAVPVDEIAKEYQITHYPVLIDKKEVRQ